MSPSLPSSPTTLSIEEAEVDVALHAMYIYPIKSCAAVDCGKSWLMSRETGVLMLDREWAIVDSMGVALTQKRCPGMRHIVPTIDTAMTTVTLTCQNKDMQAKQHVSTSTSAVSFSICGTPILTTAQTGAQNLVTTCKGVRAVVRVGRGEGIRSAGDDHGDGNIVDCWLTDVLGLPCALVRTSALRESATTMVGKREGKKGRSFANTAPLSVVSLQALRRLNAGDTGCSSVATAEISVSAAPTEHEPIIAQSFRPNWVVSENREVPEQDWISLVLAAPAPLTNTGGGGGLVQEGQIVLDMVGQCPRCVIVNAFDAGGKLRDDRGGVKRQRSGGSTLASVSQHSRQVGGKRTSFGTLFAPRALVVDGLYGGECNCSNGCISRGGCAGASGGEWVRVTCGGDSLRLIYAL